MKPRRDRLNPYRIMCLLLYSDHDCVTWHNKEGRVTVQAGPFARILRVPSSRLREYLSWLEQYGFIDELSFKYGESSFKIRMPDNLKEQ